MITLSLDLPSKSRTSDSLRATINDMNCVGALVSFEDGVGNTGSCQLSNGGVVTNLPIGALGGLVAWNPAVDASANIQVPNVFVDVPLRIAIIGFNRGAQTSCALFGPGFDPDALGYSEPFVLANQGGFTAQGGGGTLQIGATFDANYTIQDCVDNAFEDDNAFDPNTIAGLAHWYDASDPNTVFTDTGCTVAAVNDGDSVQCWMDKKNGKPMKSATVGEAPLLKLAAANTRNALDFDGGNDALRPDNGQVVAAAETTTFIVYTIDAAANKTLFGVNDGGTDVLALTYDANPRPSARFGNNSANSPTNIVINDISLLTMKASQSGPNVTIFQDGVTKAAVGPVAFPTAKDLYVGAHHNGANGAVNFHDGKILEILYYQQVVSEADRSTIENYLNLKWNIF